MRFGTYLVLIPAIAIAAALAVANRGTVVFSLDPFSDIHPALAFQAPLYVFLFLALILGVFVGGLVTGLARRPRQAPSPEPRGSTSKTLVPLDARERPDQNG